MYCGCLPTWEIRPLGLGWPTGWPGKAIWMSCASAPKAETTMPGTGWPRHRASRDAAQARQVATVLHQTITLGLQAHADLLRRGAREFVTKASSGKCPRWFIRW